MGQNGLHLFLKICYWLVTVRNYWAKSFLPSSIIYIPKVIIQNPNIKMWEARPFAHHHLLFFSNTTLQPPSLPRHNHSKTTVQHPIATHAEMNISIPKLSLILRPFLLSLFLSVSAFTFIASLTPHHRRITVTSQQPTKTPPISVANSTGDLRIRPGYSSYNAYIQHQLNKSLNPKLRQIWKTRDWDRKVRVFAQFFDSLRQRNHLFNTSKALSIGARVGQEVEALRRIGVSDSIGMDLVPCPPLVVKGDFHAQPFENETYDFEFSNVFDHALYPWKFIGEIERTLKGGGVCVLHVALSRRADKYSANDLYSVRPLVELFKESELVEVKKVDGFGLDTEVVFRKKRKSNLRVDWFFPFLKLLLLLFICSLPVFSWTHE